MQRGAGRAAGRAPTHTSFLNVCGVMKTILTCGRPQTPCRSSCLVLPVSSASAACATAQVCGAMQPGWPLSLCLWIKIECACAAGRPRQRGLRASTGLLRDAASLTPGDVLTGSNAVCLVGGAQRACLACSLTPLHGHGGQPPACRPLCGLFCWRQQCLHNAEQPLQLLSNGGQHKACAGAPWARP